MVHTTLVPNLLRKATRSMTIKISEKKMVQPQDPQKVYPLHQKLHQQVLLINASSMYHYISQHAKNIGIVRHVEKNIVQRKTFPQTNLIENFTPHSCRSASTTKAFNMSLDIMDALGKVCWSNAK